MTQQKTEAELTNKVIKNIQQIIQYLRHSEKYRQKTALISKLEGMIEKVEQNPAILKLKGSTKKRTAAWLNLAMDNQLYSERDKSMLINDCMEQVLSPVWELPEDIIREISVDHLTNEDRVNLTQDSPRLFKNVWTIDHLLPALFMGEEDFAAKIVHAHPDLLFKRGTYKMPLLNNDGTESNESEQIYHHVTPLELMLYSGDWQMWACILPLIPEEKDEEVFQTMQALQHGGPDLVKIGRDPTTLSVQKLRNLLHNRNGIFYREVDHQIELYFVDIHPETGEKEVRRLIDPQDMSTEDQTALHQFKQYMRDNIAMHSSLRSSDAQHALIARLFGMNLARNGIHYTLNGVGYQDTHDGCARLKNAYKKYLEILNVHVPGTSRDAVDTVWNHFVAMSQRLAMVHTIQRFCEKNQPSSLGKNKNELKLRYFVRTDEFLNCSENRVRNQKVYPLRVASGLGFSFGLYKMRKGCLAGSPALASSNKGKVPIDNLERVCLIENVREVCFKEHMLKLELKLYPSSGCSSGLGCVVS